METAGFLPSGAWAEWPESCGEAKVCPCFYEDKFFWCMRVGVTAFQGRDAVRGGREVKSAADELNRNRDVLHDLRGRVGEGDDGCDA